MKRPPETAPEINLNTLEEDAREQHQLLYTWGMELAAARKAAKRAKAKVKVAAAELAKDFRKDYEAFGYDKCTDKVVEEFVAMAQSYKDALEEQWDREEEEDILDAYVKSLNERGDMIKVESQLHGQMYFARPNLNPNQQTQQSREAAMKAASKPTPRKKG